MKVVVNTRNQFLKLAQVEMELICSLLGWTVTGSKPQTGSADSWFNDERGVRVVDWMKFRSHPVLVQLVEEGKLHKGLEIVEIPEGTNYEIVHPSASEYYDAAFSYPGEYVKQWSPSEWYPQRLIDLWNGDYESLHNYGGEEN